ncbi:HAD-IB family hydrolase [Anaerococcus sp. AGMB00486]|uniref:phosphoserine phosphatase n=2 Tax=Anaerococcus TaxID=165779 RepID=A0ABX2N7M3_9FIRM|nr:MULTISPECIES: HAD-IB family hydrolase [Anaerococcus]MDY3006252.1 HAD-IB family hydrolase [Anaerococcus porci]MSS76868.1 HAD-IB family hydrolase [Anaerococcus porci]NVF10648.1 HAD-IB family hydrolase [Anaerococcus faecalis]
MGKNKAAFFDIDGTLFRNSLLIEHFYLLTKNNIIDNKAWYEYIKPLYQKYQDRKGSYEDYLDKASILYQKNLIGLDKSTIDKYAKIAIDINKSKIYRITKNAIKYHKENGYKVFVISGSPDFLVKEFAKLYGADHTIATKYIFDEDKKFTGEIYPMWDSKNKEKSIDFLKDKYDIDLNNSHAYGDTNGDFSMFVKVGFAHAINPSYELIHNLNEVNKIRDKTLIHIERKDVNYTFSLKDLMVEFKKF